MTGDAVRRACDEAIADLEAILAEKPDRTDEAMTAATTCVVRLRDGLIAQVREGGSADGAARARLQQVNAVLSLVVGSHYTLVGLRWDRIEKARDALRQLFPEIDASRA